MPDNNSDSEVEDNHSASDSDASSEEDNGNEELTIVRAENLFGLECYIANSRDLPAYHIRLYPYRDSGCMQTLSMGSAPNPFKTDTEIITEFLSRLSLYELNKIDSKVLLCSVLRTLRKTFGLFLPLNLPRCLNSCCCKRPEKAFCILRLDTIEAG